MSEVDRISRSSGSNAGEDRRPRVLVLSLSDFAMDARLIRQAAFLADDFHVVAASVGSGPPAAAEFIELSPRPVGGRGETAARIARRLAGRYERAYWTDETMRRWRDELARTLPLDVMVVNDLSALPLARAVGGDVPIVFDAHEHWTSESAAWSALTRMSMRGAHEWIVDEYVPHTAAMMTVSPGIAEAYRRRTGMAPALVTNAPNFHELEPSTVTEPIRLVHIGLADPRRRIEDTIEAVRALGGRFQLDVILRWDNDYRRSLEDLAGTDGSIRVLPPVPTQELIRTANAYDVGVFLLPGDFPNQVHVLPNKLFDYIQARLAVAIGPSPEMVKIVEQWDCGVVSGEFSAASFAEALSTLTVAEVERLKRNSARAARELTAEANRETVVQLVRGAIARG